MLATVAAATAMVLIGGTTPAYAATFTVGPPAAGAFNFAGTAGTTLLTNTTTGAQLTCSSSTAAGNSQYGPGQSGVPIGRITATTFSNCTGPLGMTFGVTHIGTWNLNAASYNAGGDYVDGTITNIAARLSGPLCSATVTGSVPARFFNSPVGTNTPARLQVLPTNPGTLLVSSVSGCFGLMANGNRANFSGTYTIGTPVPLRITSP